MSYSVASRLEAAFAALRQPPGEPSCAALDALSLAVREAADELRTSWDAGVEAERDLGETIAQLRRLTLTVPASDDKAH